MNASSKPREALEQSIVEAQAKLKRIEKGPARNSMQAAAAAAHLAELQQRLHDLGQNSPLVSRNQRFEVLSSEWGHNGSFHVAVIDREQCPLGLLAAPKPSPNHRRIVRNLARRVDKMQKIQWVRIDSIRAVRTRGGVHAIYQLTASRLDPSYR